MTFRQNDYLFDDGKTGRATGDHLDISIALYDKKEDIQIGWNNYYDLISSKDPSKYMILKNDTTTENDIYQGKKYLIKKEDEIKNETGKYKTLANLKVRTGPGKNYNQKYVKDLSKDGKKHATSSNLNDLALYQKGTVFDAIKIIKTDDEIWAKTYSGYVNIKNKNNINCIKIA